MRHRLVYAPTRNASMPYEIQYSTSDLKDPFTPECWVADGCYSTLSLAMVAFQSKCGWDGVVIAQSGSTI